MNHPDADLFAQVRSKLCDGDLWPLLDGNVIAGPGTGDSCVVCTQPIGSGEADYEVTRPSDKTTVHVHVLCYQAWTGESRQSA